MEPKYCLAFVFTAIQLINHAKFRVEIDREHIYTLYIKITCETITNMATMRRFGVLRNKLKAYKICTYVSCSQQN